MTRLFCATVCGLVVSAVLLTFCPFAAIYLFDVNAEWAQ